MSEPRKWYPGDVNDEEWAFVAPYLTLMIEDTPQRDYPPRDVFDALCWLVKTGAHRLGCQPDAPATLGPSSCSCFGTAFQRKGDPDGACAAD